MTETTYTTNPFKAPKTTQRIKDVAKFIAEATPIIGDGIAISEIVDEVNKKDTNWFLVGALGGATILGLIPGVGDAAAKLVKKGAKRAFDVSKRIEIDLNVLGSTGGNIKIKPEDIADVQAKKIQKILKQEKNVNDNFYMLHGGTDFDKMDLKASGLGEPGSFRPLGRGIYGSRIVDPKNIETIKNAYLQASRFAGHFGTSITGNYAGFSHPLYKQAFKDANIPIETTESLLKELQEKVPIEVTTEQVGKIHLFKVPRTKELKVYDFRNRKGIAQNTEDIKITYPREFSSRFTIASPKFGDSQVVLQPLGEVEEMAIHDTSIVERISKLDLPEEIFENINQRKLRTNELDPNYPYKSIVDKKLENLKNEAQFITDRENLNPKTMEINLLKDLQNKGYIDKSVNIDELPDVEKEKLFNYPEDVENLVDQEDFLKEMQKDIEVSRRNVFVPEDRLELGEDSTQSLGLDSGKRIPKRTVEYNKGGVAMATQDQQMQEMLQDGGMKDDGMDRDPVSGNEVPPGSLASEVRDDIPAQLSEGEYVIPADAVQYHGLRFYEQSVQDAKRGLAEMQANGRIGGTPMPANQESSDAPVNFNIEDFMAEIGAEPQQQEMPMQANKGGLVRGFAPGGSSSDIYTPDLDFSNVQEKFPSGTKSYHTRRYINDKCEIKLINSTAEGSPAMSVPEDFVKVVSNDGLKRLKSCGLNDPEMGLTDEEKEILGPDKVKEYEDGTLPEEEATKSPEETQAPPKSEREDKPRDSSDFITTWDATDFENYVDDFEARASSGATWFDKTLGKIFTPIMEFNQPYILGRAYQLITTGNLSDEEIQKILPVFKLTYGDPKSTMSGISYNAEGQKVPINFVWDAERGMYVQGDIDAIINSKEIEIPDLQIDKENKDDKDNTEPGDLSSLNLTGEGSLERLGPGGDSMLASNSPSIAKRIADMRKNQTRISDAYGGGSGPNLASGKFNRTPPSSTDSIDSGSVLVNRQKDRENDRNRDRDDNTIDAEKMSKPTVIKDRTDSSGKKVGQKGYKSALRERKEREKIEAAQEAGKGYKGGFGFNEGGTPTKKSLAKKRTTKKK